MSRSCRKCFSMDEGCQEEAQKKGREEGEVDEGSEEREMRQEIAQEAVAGIEEKASTQDGAKETAQRTAGERVKQNNWDCSQIENEEEEETGRREGDGTG